ncbi:ABC transporter substrate-binding protein [Nocardioides sp. Arc9.136]|uniref:ABC transporter substrate-binding protein n=1 Tax=Nocardioides sp. Arc9.136 TaxID=2996826 RepID=UPI0026665205|nr:ABC transporter substrate-binding protein [Nocardioides sp. Arc9.136]WKN48927.1 ABC transporter substrate-binding protein [Nocardioides sp. Arc9.136]
MSRHLSVGRGARIAVAAVVSAALTAGCSAGGSDGSSGGGGGSDTLTVNTSFVIKNIDPAMEYEATGALTVNALYDTLVTFEGSDVGEPVGELAESFEASDDATTFTFKLHEDATFSDGTPVTAEDVVFSLNRLKNLKGSPSVIVAGMSFEATDESTVVVTSDEPNPNVPTILAMPSTGIVNSKVAKENGATDAEDAAKTDSATQYLDQNPAGSGPYVLESFDPSSQVVLKANPEYWGEAPEFSRVVISNMDVQNQKLTVSKATSATVALDLSGSSLEGLPESLQQSGAQDTYYFLTLHQDPAVDEVTSNLDFVRALRASIDYAGVAKLFGENAQPAAGVVPPAFPGALEEADAQVQDLDAAADFLDDAGLDQPKVSLMYPSITYRGVDLGTIAAKIQGDAKKAGIEIELNPQPIAAFLDAQSGGKVAMRFSPQSLNYPVAASLVNNLAPGQSTAATTGWTPERATPEAIAAGEDVLGTLDPEAQVTALQEWQRVLNEDSPYIPLAYNAGTVVATPDLTGAEYSPAGWQLDVAAVGKK